MKPYSLRLLLVAGGLIISIAAGAMVAPALLRPHVQIKPAALEAAKRQYPNFTLQQHAALQRARNTAKHPLWRDLPAGEAVKRMSSVLIQAVRSSVLQGASQSAANFLGNRTVVSIADNHLLGLKRQPDCSLTLRDATYSFVSGPSLSYVLAASISDYDRVLHNLAGLSTIPGQYPAGCGDPVTGMTTRKAVFMGTTTAGVKVGAGSVYNAVSGRYEVHAIDANADDSLKRVLSLAGSDDGIAVAAGDFNGDGNSDLISLNEGTAGTAVVVFLGNADGSFQSPIRIALSGNNVLSAVVDDLNQDGHADIAVSTRDNTGYYLGFIAGNGDGSFQAPSTTALTPPSGVTGTAYLGLMAADLHGTGHKDLVTGEGILLVGQGNGIFVQAAATAFQNGPPTSNYGPSVIAADLNKDGKLDLAASSTSTIGVYIGAGNGSFVKSHDYASIDNVGYLNVADLDGDGNLDLYSGLGNGGFFGGDQFSFNQGYALMGHGDGTFAGAPVQPFVYTGNNLADLNGDGHIDAVGVNIDLSFTSYLGDGQGGFSAHGSLATTPITLNGQSYTVSGIDSYALGDIDGDGRKDLLYIGANFTCRCGPAPNFFYTPGIFMALGHGDGSFAAPVFQAAPSFVAAPDFGTNPQLSNLHLADVNGDGKDDLIYDYSDLTYIKPQTYLLGTAVQLSNGDGSFQAPHLIQFYSGQTSIFNTSKVAAIADANRDGHADLLFLTPTSDLGGSPRIIQLRLGKGDGSFGAAGTIVGPDLMNDLLDGTQYAPLELADMNGDGALDMVALGASKSGQLQVSVSPGNGDGSYRAPILKNYSEQFLHQAMAVADFDGDGIEDVVLSGQFGGIDNGISFGNGDGTLQSATSGSSTVPNQAIYLLTGGATRALDLNGDGRPDILSGKVTMLSEPAGSASASTALRVSASTLTTLQPLDLTVTVGSASGSARPTGTVTFHDGSAVLGSVSLSASGTAALHVAGLTAGTHALSAKYSGDASYAAGLSNSASVRVLAVSAGGSGLVDQSDSAVSAHAGKPFSYVLTFFNLGVTNATQLRLVDSLPANTRLISATPSQGHCTHKQPVVCTFGTVASGASVTVTLSVVRAKPGSVKNKAVLTYKMVKPGTKKIKSHQLTTTKTTAITH